MPESLPLNLTLTVTDPPLSFATPTIPFRHFIVKPSQAAFRPLCTKRSPPSRHMSDIKKQVYPGTYAQHEKSLPFDCQAQNPLAGRNRPPAGLISSQKSLPQLAEGDRSKVRSSVLPHRPPRRSPASSPSCLAARLQDAHRCPPCPALRRPGAAQGVRAGRSVTSSAALSALSAADSWPGRLHTAAATLTLGARRSPPAPRGHPPAGAVSSAVLIVGKAVVQQGCRGRVKTVLAAGMMPRITAMSRQAVSRRHWLKCRPLPRPSCRS